MHREYIRHVPGAKKAVLMVHGIVGTPRHFDFLLKHIPEDVSVVNILLPGHGAKIKEFAASSMKQWREAVEREMEKLCQTYSHVVVVAYSMGTLLAAEAAKVHPQVKGMLLLNVPLRVLIAPRMMAAAIRWCLGMLREDHPLDVVMQNCSSVDPQWQAWGDLHMIDRFCELLMLCKKTRRCFEKEIKVPTYVFQGDCDEVVSAATNRHLQRNSHIRRIEMTDCGHFFYTDEAIDQMHDAMGDLLEEC